MDSSWVVLLSLVILITTDVKTALLQQGEIVMDVSSGGFIVANNFDVVIARNERSLCSDKIEYSFTLSEGMKDCSSSYLGVRCPWITQI